jgi:5,10-methylenetetrahydromethanopterin reductase
MRIGVGLDGRLALPFPQLREAARLAEGLGFESAWTPAGGVPDAFHVCGAWGQDTSMITGISVVPAPRMWTPMSLAVQSATVAQVSAAPFILGIGTGGAGPAFWQSLGLGNQPISAMRAWVLAMRGLLDGETVTMSGPGISLTSAALGVDGPTVPVYLAALGPQMVRLAGEVADGVLLNWASIERIAESRAFVAEGAARTGRPASACAVTMYIRICIDDDAAAARHAFGEQVLGYALSRPEVPLEAGYRGMFGQMGYDEVLRDLEARRDRGAGMDELVAAAPDEMFEAVGYYGPADGAAAAFARLSTGLDETIVRVVTARPGLEPVVEAMEALTPAKIRAAA